MTHGSSPKHGNASNKISYLLQDKSIYFIRFFLRFSICCAAAYQWIYDIYWQLIIRFSNCQALNEILFHSLGSEIDQNLLYFDIINTMHNEGLKSIIRTKSQQNFFYSSWGILRSPIGETMVLKAKWASVCIVSPHHPYLIVYLCSAY